MSGDPTSVSTHILDTSIGRPAAGVAVDVSVRAGGDDPWSALATAATNADGRCTDLPALPEGTTHVRLAFATEAYFRGAAASAAAGQPAAGQAGEGRSSPRARDGDAFFPEVTVVFAVEPGTHYHVPLLLNPFGYAVYRGS